MTNNPAVKLVDRNRRRKLLSDERRRRKSGRWGPWETISLLPGEAGAGWLTQVNTAHRNDVFAVLQRDLPTVTHFAISSLSGIRPTWHEMQRIKDELAGRDATGVEVYPPHAQIIDGADMFHLWILGEPLGFGLADDSVIPETESTKKVRT